MKTNKTPDKSELAHFKRLYEVCMTNPREAVAFLENPEEWLEGRKLQVDAGVAADAVTMLLGLDSPADGSSGSNNPYLTAFEEAINEIHNYYTSGTMSNRLTNMRFRAWYSRCSEGYRFTSKISRHKEGMIYIPVSFELSEGCSVGCDFCCLAADKLKGVFRYSSENANLWKGILKVTKEEMGAAAGMGICYFATEPFDNPDYERLLEDFHDVFGRYPQTTTATAERNVGRTKAFMAKLGERELALAALRISITSLKQLNTIHSAFSPEELLSTELLPNNPESALMYAKAGRSRKLSESLKDKNFTEEASGTCTCGFVVNMVKKSIMLISPKLPDEKHPLGMRIWDERSFEDTADYRKTILNMMEEHMPQTMPMDKQMALGTHLTWQRRGYCMRICGDGISRTISLSEEEHSCFLAMVEKGMTFVEIAEGEQLTEFEGQQLLRKLNVLYDAGCLEDIDLM